jgi:CRP-like cAMP-binding protein
MMFPMSTSTQIGFKHFTRAAADAPAARSSRMERNDALAKNLPFLTENDHMLIMSKSKVRALAPGEALIKQGFSTEAFYMIRSGTARVERNGAKLAEVGPGSVCGEMIVLDGSPASASIIVEEPMNVDVIECSDLQELFTAFPHVGSRFFRSLCVNLSKKLRATSGELASLERQR